MVSFTGFRALLCAALVCFAVPVFAQAWDETTQGGGDAGDLPGTAQVVSGTGALSTLSGQVTVNTDRDLYRIRIANAATFSATTVGGPATDTVLTLFQTSGVGIALNDDEAITFTLQSRLPAGNALYNTLPAGEYLLGVSVWQHYPTSATGGIWTGAQVSVDYTLVYPPLNTGPITSWTMYNGTGSGAYTVTLTGCEFVQGVPPGDPEINVRRNSVTVVSGGAVALGNVTASASPLTFEVQNLGATQNLQVTGITTQGTPVNCAPAYGALTPASPIGPAAASMFTASLGLSALGPFSFTISIANNDANENPYLISVNGTVIPPAMQGNYTIAQTGSPSFSSVGAAFDALEGAGLTGAVTLTITDSATYNADASYSLGVNATGTYVTINGLSAANNITLRAAPGQAPTIVGSATGAVINGTTGRGALAIACSFTTVEGLTATGGPNFGIIANAYGANLTDVTIRRCRAHGIASGPGIAFVGFGSFRVSNAVVENNFIWNCVTTALPGAAMPSAVDGSLSFRNAATSTIIRHNTVLHNSTIVNSSAFRTHDGSGAPQVIGTFASNIFVVTSATLPALRFGAATHEPAPAGTNFNCYHCTVFEWQVTTPVTFTTWQGTGRDTGGIEADPLLVNAAGPAFDLHLQAPSPCRDPAGHTSPVTIDIDGDSRPQGTAPDIGADEVVLGPQPEIDVQRPAASSLGAGTAPVADLLGNVPVTGQAFVYTIENTGPATLNLTGTPVAVAVSAQTGCTAVVTQPATTSVATVSSTTFSVLVTPAGAGAFSFTLTIESNDLDEPSYVINASGTGFVPNLPAVAMAPVGSSFTGVVNGPFTQSVAPGGTLSTASVELSDPESDSITITNIVPPATALVGVTAPTAPAPGSPVLLAWSGSVDAANSPGDYTWTVTFEDAVNGTPVIIDVTISVPDVAPVHVPAAGISGNGSVGTPYLATYTVGLGGTVTVSLANVSDANSGQVVSISGTVDVTALGGTGFQFMLVAGQLVGSPAGTLVAADAGVQVWEVTVTDGTNPVIITVSVTVNSAITFTSSTTLTAAERNGTYPGSTITVAGGTGAISMAITAGALPANLSMSSTGAVSGTTTDAVATYNFTVTATDSLGASTALAFSIDVVDPAAGLPVITNGASLPSGTLNVAYNLSLTVSGGTSPYTFSITGGNLPTGLSMSAAGVISGTPSVVGPSSFTVRVQDSSSRGVFNSSAFTLAIIAPKKEDEGSDCTAGAGGMGVLALLAPIGAIVLRRRRN